ncbi:hypothetical protein SCHPADRAFT_182192 [Schizopora paradoxa]|uniref:Uncharacterized protein n=1 Tax=Schizopora paradoxa TaxID=27342 RepID=A0A0H2SJ64_9AGAM|nr:hypothetical protein SCHPADRAFT_182192 [Schizopora paradoxa]
MGRRVSLVGVTLEHCRALARLIYLTESTSITQVTQEPSNVNSNVSGVTASFELSDLLFFFEDALAIIHTIRGRHNPTRVS